MSLPANITISAHPCVAAKISQLRSSSSTTRETKLLVHELSLLLATEALGRVLVSKPVGSDVTPLGWGYERVSVGVKGVEEGEGRIVLVPILRSGLAMVEAFETLLPAPVAIHHLGLFREKTTLQPVEYYNNLPTSDRSATPPCDLAVIVDPIIATGGTAEAAVQTLKEWGVKKILVVAILGSEEGIARVANEDGGEGIEILVGAMDKELGGKDGGMIVPGIGDIGDRLFLTMGK